MYRWGLFHAGPCPEGGDFYCYVCNGNDDDDCMDNGEGWEKCANDGEDQAEVIMIFLDAQSIKTQELCTVF